MLPVLATNRQQREFDILSLSTLLPIWSTLLPVCMGPKRHASNKVDRLEFNSVASVYGALEIVSVSPVCFRDRECVASVYGALEIVSVGSDVKLRQITTVTCRELNINHVSTMQRN